MRVAELKDLARERGLRGYSRLRKAELIALLQNNPPPPPAPRNRPPRPATRPPPPRSWVPAGPPPQAQLVRFRPDRPRQPELMRRLEGISTPPAPRPPRPAPRPHPKQDTEFKPYQLKPKRDTNMEPPIVESPTELPPDPKKLKCMKKKLDELNRKIRHSRKKHHGLIHK